MQVDGRSWGRVRVMVQGNNGSVIGVKKMENFLMLYLTNLIQIVIILTVKEMIW